MRRFALTMLLLTVLPTCVHCEDIFTVCKGLSFEDCFRKILSMQSVVSTDVEVQQVIDRRTEEDFVQPFPVELLKKPGESNGVVAKDALPWVEHVFDDDDVDFTVKMHMRREGPP